MELSQTTLQILQNRFPQKARTWSHWSSQITHAFSYQSLQSGWPTFIREIDGTVKEYVIRYLQKIIASLDEYYITGALPILESVETAIGHVYFDKNYKEFLTETDLGKKILNVLHATASATTLAVGLPEIGHKVISLLSQ